MNIYIYGDKSFKQEMHKILDRANIKFRLDGFIEDVDSLELLKESIKHSPQDVYLIDSAKIIDKDSLVNKIKFLSPKDGIEKEFLQEHGIGDVSFDSVDKLVKHIVKRLEYIESQNPHSEDDLIKESLDIENNEEETIQDEIASEQSDDISEDKENLIDEELSDLLEYDETIDDEDEDELSEKKSKSEDILDIDDEFFNMDLPLDLLSFDEGESVTQDDTNDIANELDNLDNDLANLMTQDNDVLDKNTTTDDLEELDDLINLESNDLVVPQDTQEKEIKKEQNTKTTQGENMGNELDELSALNESDILSALDNLDLGAMATTANVSKPAIVPEKSSASKSVDTSLSIQSGDLGQLSALIAQLLQNKTLDISIKIRD